MNDRKLLELAAKAAGYDVGAYTPTISDDSVAQEIMYCRDGKTVHTNWNPLTDDGDAIRLAVKIGMRLELDNERSRSRAQKIPNGEWFTAPHNEDQYSATRRAIVRAAAEIGKTL